ncbi:MAG: hypothetical protein ACD_37C00387G0001 [uncultured bacterium]|nr:MAG: hypothetical protein ACD_37C00387G0001 [uncultured bacterium]KKR16055.1 MAG: hypothetical protein UT46_C0009G0007 [Candidatus Levybacteria bacterium GW2011_GWA1_39_34]KKR51444.1 MAG: hypothetical protein UT87_C0006G0024 [Candidatus Levybacteria bacterium GW2011_GWC1_40_19]KKR71079.1 MAG: hypothetical protein UU15_C0060G0004 [Candidatus Levybacteria bacterium GW2011_GWC2_40_7]KKR94859.1 MAG: hypothetical protein UU45_C0006G0021 [Candidatus Levybacteria bacterium GW2011_GWA2_41_15]KKS014
MGQSRFSDGFLLGVIIGGGIALLFTTKKGNKILKAVSEEGFEGLSKLIDDASQGVDNYVEKKEEEGKVEGFSFEDQNVKPPTNGDTAVKELKPARRFFRRIKK